MSKLLSLFNKSVSSVLLLSAPSPTNEPDDLGQGKQTKILPCSSAESDSEGLKSTTDKLDMPSEITIGKVGFVQRTVSSLDLHS